MVRLTLFVSTVHSTIQLLVGKSPLPLVESGESAFGAIILIVVIDRVKGLISLFN